MRESRLNNGRCSCIDYDVPEAGNVESLKPAIAVGLSSRSLPENGVVIVQFGS